MKIDNHMISNFKTPFASNSKEMEVLPNKELFNKLRFLEIQDRIDISKDGQKLVDGTKDDQIDLNDVKVLKVDVDFKTIGSSPDEAIDALYMDSAYKYKEEMMKAENQEEIDAIEKVFMRDLESNIENIANAIDSYYDRGRALGDIYSEKPLEDLFDKDLFKENLKASVLNIRDQVMNSDISKEELQKKLSKQNTLKVEDMSFNDLKAVYKFINEPIKVDEDITEFDNQSGERIAKQEKELNRRVDDMNMSGIITGSLRKVHKRMSDSYMKHVAFKYEEETFEEDMLGFDEKLHAIYERLKMLGLYMDEVKENYGVTPDNKRLIGLLSRKQALDEEYRNLLEEKSKRQQEFNQLDRNKHTIVEKESYQMVKESYDKEMIRKDNEDEE